MENLESVKVGDKLAMSGSGMNRQSYDIVTVTRVTKTLLVVQRKDSDYEYRFDKFGNQKTQSQVWDRSHLYALTPEIVNSIKRERAYWKAIRALEELSNRVKSARETMPLEDLLSISETLQKITGEDKDEQSLEE